jgi:hypothetical protein
MCARPTPPLPQHVLFSFAGLQNVQAGGDASEGDGAAGCRRGCSICLERSVVGAARARRGAGEPLGFGGRRDHSRARRQTGAW